MICCRAVQLFPPEKCGGLCADPGRPCPSKSWQLRSLSPSPSPLTLIFKSPSLGGRGGSLTLPTLNTAQNKWFKNSNKIIFLWQTLLILQRKKASLNFTLFYIQRSECIISEPRHRLINWTESNINLSVLSTRSSHNIYHSCSLLNWIKNYFHEWRIVFLCYLLESVLYSPSCFRNFISTLDVLIMINWLVCIVHLSINTEAVL